LFGIGVGMNSLRSFFKQLLSKERRGSNFNMKNLLFKDITEDIFPDVGVYRNPSPGSHNGYEFSLNFPEKTEHLAKGYYFQRAEMNTQKSRERNIANSAGEQNISTPIGVKPENFLRLYLEPRKKFSLKMINEKK